MIPNRALPWATITVFVACAHAGCGDDEPDDTSSGSTQSTSSGPTSSSSSAGSGAAGASGAAGGEGGAGAEGGTSSGGTGPGGMGGGGAGGGPSCTWPDAAKVCAAGTYCHAPGCGAGTCVSVRDAATETPDKQPVCGCDGVDYWNESVAATHAMSVSTSGGCLQKVFCGGFANIQCAAGLHCNYGGGDQSVCLISDAGGACWGMPQTCPVIAVGATTRACGAAACTEECALIKQGTTFYEDPGCPQ